jgi:NADH:ubiquinone oxidoreductase subunit 3 (subunit A)
VDLHRGIPVAGPIFWLPKHNHGSSLHATEFGENQTRMRMETQKPAVPRQYYIFALIFLVLDEMVFPFPGSGV